MPKRAPWKRWTTAILAVAAADVAILFSAGLVLAASQQIHASAMSLVAAMLADVGALVPPRVSEGLGAILGVLGAGWLQQSLGPTLSGRSGVSALGGVLAAPVYAAIRRRARSAAQSAPKAAGAPPHRIYVPASRRPEPVEGPLPVASRDGSAPVSSIPSGPAS